MGETVLALDSSPGRSSIFEFTVELRPPLLLHKDACGLKVGVDGY